jgi:4-hydroxy-tetrahydrodipicolinate synthase
MFHGSIVALVTPMTPTGDIDMVTFKELIEKHIEAGTNAIVVCGTTGEAAAFNENETQELIKVAIETASDRIPIIVGTGTNSTRETIHRTQIAMDLGADACLIITPYCIKPTQEGLFQHYETIAKAVPIPILLYNVASRTACDLLPETVQRLSAISNIVGIKEANSDSARIKELRALCGDSIDLLSGDDASALAFMLQGGKGVISVTANVAPKKMVEMCKAALEGNLRLAAEINTGLMLLHKNLFLESNPIPVKWALKQMGWVQEGIRLPLTPLSLKYHALVKEAMEHSGVL